MQAVHDKSLELKGKNTMSDKNSPRIVASYASINQKNSSNKNDLDNKIKQLKDASITPITLTIDPLSTPWTSEQKDNHFRSGCAPIMALEHAYSLIEQGCHAVIIQADEPLKTGYTREERHQLMAVYDDETTIADLYNDLAMEFINNHQLNEDKFKAISSALFENYQATYQQHIDDQQAHFSLPSEQWFNNVTSLFRGVDCANPLIDFEGKLLICSKEIVEQLAFGSSIEIVGVNCQQITTVNEVKDLKIICKYNHLITAIEQASIQAKINFSQQFLQGNALLEVYTCYPIVPMAFLQSSGIVNSVAEIPPLLNDYSVTVTGGMNLARAPWNAPSLNALITMAEKLLIGDKEYGLVHGNGGLGYRQGVAILKKSELL